jgi:hypothetical protein
MARGGLPRRAPLLSPTDEHTYHDARHYAWHLTHFLAWSLHMAFIIVFANLWGLYFKEWKGASRGTRAMVWVGLTVLVLSTVITGYANRMGAE